MIECQNINKIYKDTHSLKDINLTINQGECVILEGISGSGKSTLLSIISGVNKPTNGMIKVDGEYIAKLPDKFVSEFRASSLGFIFQSFNLIDSFSVKENIAVPLMNSNLSAKEIESKVDIAMQKAKISHKADSKAGLLSGGEKQRCTIARAIVNNPKIILADEPTANLDKDNSIIFLEFVAEFVNDGKTIVIATHDEIFDTLAIPKRVIKLKNGEIV
jgi:putative ABC transport system ATP-binding protein